MATPYTDYGGEYGSGGGDFAAWQSTYAQQQEEERRRIEEQLRLQQEEEMRRQQEEEARRAAEAQAQQAAQQPPQQPPPETFDRSQPQQTLGDMMNPPQQANTYDPGAPPPGAPPPQSHTMPDGSVMAGPPMAQPPPEPAIKPGAPLPDGTRSYAAGAGGVVEQPRDYTATPMTGAELEAFGGNPHVQGADAYYSGTAFPTGEPSPDRKTSSMDLDTFNQDIRTSEVYQQFIHNRGLWKPNGQVTEWSDDDREAWKQILEQQGVRVDGGMKIDNAGNINQKNTLGKKLAKVAIIAGGVAATIATGGAASPWLATAIGAGTGAGTGAIDGGMKGALIGAGLGAAGGYFAGGGNIPGIGGGGGGAAAGAGTAATVAAPTVAAVAAPAAAAAGGGMLAGALPHVITGLAGLGTAYMGNRAQSKANERAEAASERGAAASAAELRAQREFDREQRDLDRADAERRYAEERDMANKMWASQEDERLFKRNIFMEDRAADAAERAARAAGGSGGGSGGSYTPSYSGPSGPSEAELRKQQAIRNLDALLRQGTPGLPGAYVPATAAGPTGARG